MKTRYSDSQKALLDKGKEIGIDETELMNRLQNLGLVSDNSVWLNECADVDCRAAMKFAPWTDE